MASKRWKLDLKDVYSGLRHAVFPTLSAIVVEGANAVDPSLIPDPVHRLIATILLAAIGRIGQRAASNLSGQPVR